MTTPDFEKIAGDLHNEVHEVAALVDAHTRVEIGWAPEDAIPILSEKLREMYEAGKSAAELKPLKLEPGATYALQIRECITQERVACIKAAVSAASELAGCKFVVLAADVEIVMEKD